MAPLSFLHLQGPGRCRAGKTIHKESEMFAMITPRIEKIRQNYVNAKPQISCQRAAIWTESFQTTEGQPACIRAARAFYDCCDRLGVHIFEGELVVGLSGNSASAAS